MEVEMNEIKVRRLFLSGVITLIAFIAIEFIVEGVFGNVLFSGAYDAWYGKLVLPNWTTANYALNIFIALVNSTMMMWLYAALRPMFGVGIRTALITSVFVFTFVAFYVVNQTNLGIFPIRIASIELLYLFIELPLALMAGAQFYEAG
jgi:hypothetical protein